jgi:TldD protein
MERGAEFAEVYVERNEFTAVTLEEDKVKSAQNGLSQGVGVRVISGAKVGYAYSDDLDEEALFRAARTAATASPDRRTRCAWVQFLRRSKAPSCRWPASPKRGAPATAPATAPSRSSGAACATRSTRRSIHLPSPILPSRVHQSP